MEGDGRGEVGDGDRADTPAQWQCLGSAVLDLPAEVVARWAPGGSVVEPVTLERTRVTLGAWSWAGIAQAVEGQRHQLDVDAAGLLVTFDTELTDVEPAALRSACRVLAARCLRPAASTDESRGREASCSRGPERSTEERR